MNSRLYSLLLADHSGIKAGMVILLMTIFAIWTPQTANATHIVGGDLEVTCIGGFTYEVQLTLRRDCEFGDPEADYDKPAIVGIYTGNGQLLTYLGMSGSSVSTVKLDFPGDDTLSQTQISDCDLVGSPVCVQEAIYTGTVDLRKAASDQYNDGFIFAYQRCCRNQTLANLVNPLNTGATYTTEVSEKSFQECNSTPDLNEYPPIYICASDELSIDQSVTDAEGDSIVYSLCTPYQGATMDDPQPQQAVDFKPPYDTVVWADPYSLNDLLGNPMDPVQIDSETGEITGTPNALGQYTVGICITEYRDGELLSEIRRDFELNVRLCQDGADAGFEVSANPFCDGLEVPFTNTSENASHFKWFFDFDNDTTAQSNEFEPTYTYPDTGTYKVVMIATEDSLCFDTFSMDLEVRRNGLIPDFTYEVNSCEEDIELQAFDQSLDTIGTITDYLWTLEGEDTTLTSTAQNPTFILENSQTVMLTLEVTSSNGCTETVSKTFDVNLIDIEFTGDSLIICPGTSTELIENGNPDFDYTWSPDSTLDLSDPTDPIATPTEPTTYYVTVTDGLCVVTDSVFVDQYEQVTFTLSDLSDSCATERMLTIAIDSPDSIGTIEWSDDPSFSTILGMGDTITVTETMRQFYYARVTDSVTGCMFTDSLFVESFAVNADYEDSREICIDEEETISVTNIDPIDTLDVVWDPDEFIVSPLDSNTITVVSDQVDSGFLSFTATNQFGCILRDSVFVNFAFKPGIEFTAENECGSLTVTFNNQSDSADYMWDFGDGETSTEDNPTHTYDSSGTYTVILKNTGECMDADTQTVSVFQYENTVPDTMISCFGEPVSLNPGGNPDLIYSWSPPAILGADSTATNPTVQVDSTTTFTVEINFPGDTCTVFDTVEVVVPEEFDIAVDQGDTLDICEERPVTLSATTTIDGVDIMWLDENGVTVGTGDSVTVPIEDSDFYVAKGTDQFGCMRRDTVQFDIDLIDINIDTDVMGSFICVGDTVKITVENLDPEDSLTYQWEDNPSILTSLDSNVICVFPMMDETYVVNATNAEGCTLTDSVSVEAAGEELLDIDAVAEPDSIFFSEETQLDVINGQPGWSYVWQPEESLDMNTIRNPTAMPDSTTTYCVTVTDQNGCTGTDCVTVRVGQPECTDEFVYLPNAFSPNGDGVNDVLRLRSVFIDQFTLVIYNRWGEKVFETSTLSQGWDGTYEGEELEPGVFAYYLEAECLNGEEFAEEGNINLLK